MSDDKSTVETWEIQTPGAVWIYVWESRLKQHVQKQLSAKGTKRVNLTVEEREYNEALIPDENAALNPFTNGTLAKLVEGEPEDGSLTDEALVKILNLKSRYKAKVDAFAQDELTLQRLKALAEGGNGTIEQVAYIKDLIEKNFPVGGSQKAYREMVAQGEIVGGTRLS